MQAPQPQEQIKKHLARQFNLDRNQIETMIPGLIATLAMHLSNLEKTRQKGDLKQLGKAGHTIKGALLNLGLSECADIAYTIEKHGKAEDSDLDYQSLIDTMQTKLAPYLN